MPFYTRDRGSTHGPIRINQTEHAYSGLEQPPNHLHSLISIRTGTRSLIIFGTIDVWAVVKGSVPSPDGPASPLVQEMPVETGKRPVLCTFVLYK